MIRQGKRFLVLVAFLLVALCASVCAKELTVGIPSWESPAGKQFWGEVIIPKFKEIHPDFEVVIDRISWSADTIQVRYIAGEAPDVIQYGTDKLGSYLPMLEPLNDFINELDIDDFPPPAIEATTMNGKVYGLPWFLGIRTLVYRKSHFEKAGISSGSGPKTWDELLSFAKKLTKRGNDGEITRQGVELSSHWFKFGPWLFQGGGHYITKDGKHSCFASSGTKTAVLFAKKLYEEDMVTSPIAPDFKSGGAAMSYWHSGVFYEVSDGSDVGVSMPPQGVKRTTMIAPCAWGITNNSTNKEAARTWLRLVSAREHMLEMARLNYILPVRISLISEDPWSSDDRYRTFLEASLVAESFHSGSSQFENIVHDLVSPALQRVIFGGASVGVLDDISRRIEAVLEEEVLR